MSENTQRHKLPYIMPSQAQKHVTHNEALRNLDAMINIAFTQINITTAPTNPSEGEIFYIGQSPQNEFADHANQCAIFIDGTWHFYAPFDGMYAYDIENKTPLIFSENEWVEFLSSITPDQFAVNTSLDPNNKMSVKADSVLFSHDDITPGNGNSLVTLNRQAATNSTHLQFSTNYTTNAELGFAGDQLFRIKTSDDGQNFKTALSVDPSSGKLGIGANPGGEQLRIRSDQNTPTQFTVSNYSSANNAGTSFRLNATGGNYLSALLYGTDYSYLYSNTRMTIGTYADRTLAFRTNTINRLTISGDGRISIGTGTSSAQLSVAGAVRLGQYTVQTLPSANTNGAGSMIYVSDATGGATTAFSNGTNWLRTSHQSIIN